MIAAHGMPWHVQQLGARVEYRFSARPAAQRQESRAIEEPELERYLHLHALNRGVLVTPFHNMLLACPATTPGMPTVTPRSSTRRLRRSR